MVQRVDVELLDDVRLVGEALGEFERFADHHPLLAVDDGLDSAELHHFVVEEVKIHLLACHFGNLKLDPDVRQEGIVRRIEQLAVLHHLCVKGGERSRSRTSCAPERRFEGAFLRYTIPKSAPLRSTQWQSDSESRCHAIAEAAPCHRSNEEAPEINLMNALDEMSREEMRLCF